MGGSSPEGSPGKGPGGEALSQGELVSRVNKVIEDYGKQAVLRLRPIVRRGEGKQIVAPVQGRLEDRELRIDTIGEHMLAHLIQEAGLRAFVFGEHHNRDLAGENPLEVYFFVDPFDNSGPYRNGQDTPVYTVASAFTPAGDPIGAVIGNITNNTLYLNRGRRNYFVDLESDEIREMRRSNRTSLKGPNASLATYLGSNEYSMPFLRRFAPLIEAMHPKGILYPWGGAYIYGLLADGAVDEYVIYNEPHSEIIPGLPFALAAGCEAMVINPDYGTFKPYRVDPGALRQRPSDYKKGVVRLLVVTATPGLRAEVISCLKLQGRV